MENEDKLCNKCGVGLTLDKNWTNGRKKYRVFTCSDCIAAYKKEYRKTHVKEIIDYRETIGREKSGHIPMTSNKTCSLYLGVVVAEQVLSKVFKDVTRMRSNFPGYDFVCSRDKKIDVKSSCADKDGGWHFNINKNTIADYFLCLAFDNRNDLNPIHMWLIFGEEVNHLKTLSATKTNITKLDEYELSLSKVTKCCNVLRGV